MEIVVLGCGPSSSTPTLSCVLRKNCTVCREASENPESKNRRLNPSILVRNTATNENVLVDCGKTFREAVLRVFPSFGLEYVDAVVLTHGHADACLGLDDLREVQRSELRADPSFANACVRTAPSPMQVHCSAETHVEVAAKFDYLFGKTTHQQKPIAPDQQPGPKRWVAQLSVHEFAWFQPFQACGVSFVPLPVVHGADYISSGFEFGSEVGLRFVYISDVSAIPTETQAYLTDSSRSRIDILMIDALFVQRHHATHMNLEEALQVVELLRPKRTLLTGMGHEFDYEATNTTLGEWSTQHGLEVRMAYDGMRIALEPTAQ